MPTTRTRKKRGIRRPRPGAPLEEQRAYYEKENERLRAINSKWRFGINNSGNCFCLLAAESVEPKQNKKQKRGKDNAD